MQYNYSHDNDGAGYLLAQEPATDAHSGNVVRYNISQNDGRANTYGGIHVWGRVRNAEIYNNTIFMSASPSASPRAATVVSGGVPQDPSASVHFRNNIFVSAGAVPLVEVDDVQRASSDLRFQGNIYFAATSQWIVYWGAAAYTDFASWRNVTLQEHVNGAAVGSAANPLLTNAGAASALGDATRLETLDAYRLQPGSPAIDTALNLAGFGIAIGARDFFGTSLPRGSAADIGAGELPLAANSPRDFNGDGKPDLVWQNAATRQAVVWYMGGAQGNLSQGWSWLSAAGAPGWTLAGAGDFNGDGKPDLVWQNDSSRQVVVWYMGGPQGNIFQWSDWLSASEVPDWSVVGIGDLNGDGTLDLVWQNDATRQLVVWYMGGQQGNVFQWGDWLSSAGVAGWSVVGVSDFNRDGRLDLVWRTTSVVKLSCGIWAAPRATSSSGGIGSRPTASRGGASSAPAISTATAPPISCGRVTLQRASSSGISAVHKAPPFKGGIGFRRLASLVGSRSHARGQVSLRNEPGRHPIEATR